MASSSADQVVPLVAENDIDDGVGVISGIGDDCFEIKSDADGSIYFAGFHLMNSLGKYTIGNIVKYVGLRSTRKIISFNVVIADNKKGGSTPALDVPPTKSKKSSSSSPSDVPSTSSNKRKKTANPSKNTKTNQCVVTQTFLTCEIIRRPKDKDFMFLKALGPLPEGYASSDIFLHETSLHPDFFEAKLGDIVEIRLSVKDKSKPSAAAAFLKRCSTKRSQSDYKEFIEELEELLLKKKEGTEYPLLLRDLLKYSCIWEGICSLPDLEISLLHRVMRIFVNINNEDYEYESLMKTALKVLLSARVFRISTGEYKNLINTSEYDVTVTIYDFLVLIAKYLPHKIVLVLKICDILNPPVSTYHKILRSVSKSFKDSESISINDLDWQELPLTICKSELSGTIMEGRENLTVIPLKKEFSSVEMYYDTYLRLLREDCFCSLKQGINAYLCNTLDARDMNVYKKVEFSGYITNQQGFFILLTFKPPSNIKNWAASSALMYGNLLALSPKGDFTDCIWVTVANRELALLKKNQVIVEFCDQDQSTSDIFSIIRKLVFTNGKIVAVESPTYYKAYAPILKTLQTANIQSMPFQDELISLKCNDVTPSYFNDDSLINDNAALQNLDTELGYDQTISAFKKNLRVSSRYVFDSYQKDAIRDILKRRLAIIQGPPGCGKTFIGAKLVSLLLTINTLPARPIVVLTYKNHALNEFLKHLLSSGCKEIVRIGGRCDDTDLEQVNLSVLKKQSGKSMTYYHNLYQLRDNLRDISTKLKESLTKLSDLISLSETEFILDALSLSQLQGLINFCPSKDISVPADFQPRKVIKDGRLNLQEVKKLFNDLNNHMTILEAIEYVIASTNDKSYHDLVINSINVFFLIFLYWLPSKDCIADVNDQLNSADNLRDLNEESEANTVVPESSENDIDQEEEDEEEVERKLRERLAAVSHSLNLDDEKLNLNIFKTSKNDSSSPFALFANSHKLIDEYANVDFNKIPNLWKLSPRERYAMIQKHILQATNDLSKTFSDDYVEFEEILSEKRELENSHIAELLQNKKVIGLTITGASIHKSVLNLVKPAIVLVEEAAEVLEPQLMAVLNSNVEHLILIGDHKQLRPKVIDFKLAQHYHLEKSMMERLIIGGYPYSCLMTQNRMAPQISLYLKDIYEHLTNASHVFNIKCLPFFQHHAYFWSHSYNEITGRSHTNPQEAKLIVELTRFIINQEFEPSDITILSAYLGQTALLRKLLKSDPSPIFGDFGSKSKHRVQVQTIDMYQGDENEVVIVSLVRSNSLRKIGFLHNINRRIVAQSRAKRCVIFVGNTATLSSSKIWATLIDDMKARDLVQDYIEFNCKRHTDMIIKVKNAAEFPSANFCKFNCDHKFSICSHVCPKRCQPFHHHNNCEKPLNFIDKSRCPHLRTKLCYENNDKNVCKNRCNTNYAGCSHVCKKNCEPKHTHLSFDCLEVVSFNCKNCGSILQRKCPEKESYASCTGFRSINCPKCRISGKIECTFPDNFYKCKQPCPLKLRDCGHKCSQLCFEDCSTVKCIDCKKIKEAQDKAAKERQRIERKQDEMQVLKELEYIKNQKKTFARKDLKEHEDDAAEFISVTDKVVRYIQPEHHWYPYVTKIEKIFNSKLREKFINSQRNLIGSRQIDQKFHGTSKEAVDSIVESGFRLPSSPGMYGKGIYLASDSSKSAQNIYTKGSNQLLLCEVCLGKSKTVNTACNDMTGEQLKQEGYDSLFAKRGTKGTGGVLFDEFVVYDPDRVFPLYIIHYSFQSKCDVPYNVNRSKHFTKRLLKFERRSPIDDKYQFLYQVAAAQFLLLKSHRCLKQNIKEIYYYENPDLIAKFEKKKAEFQTLFGKTSDADEILAFHGTPHSGSVDSIMKTNFDNSKIRRTAHGFGHYFSEFPDVSIGYGANLILCRLLPGQSTEHCRQSPCLCYSHIVRPDGDKRCEMIVIQNVDQILPTYSITLG